MIKNKDKDNQAPDFWDRISEISNRDFLVEIAGFSSSMCENPWPENDCEGKKKSRVF